MHYLIDFCRLCLSLKGEFHNIWLDNIMEKVTACISELDFDANLPLLICHRCLEKMEDFFRFRNQCLQSEFFINRYMDKLVNNTHGHARCISTELKVNVINNFGTSDKYKGNVKVRKSLQMSHKTESKKCNNSKKSNFAQSLFENDSFKSINILADNTSNSGKSTNLNGRDGVFIDEEDNYNFQESENTQTKSKENKTDSKSKNVNNLDLHDPENLLIDNGLARVITDVSERVKLRKRNSSIKPLYCHDIKLDKVPKKDVAKKSTVDIKNSHVMKPISVIDTSNQSQFRCQARKSTTKHWEIPQKHEAKISNGGSHKLWKAACRNWELQRMQELGHINTGSRRSSDTVSSLDSHTLKYNQNKSPSSVEQTTMQNIKNLPSPTSIQLHHNGDGSSTLHNTHNLSIPTSIQYQDSLCYSEPNEHNIRAVTNDKGDILRNRPNNIKAVQEELLEQHQHFRDNLFSEYGFVFDKDNDSSMIVETEETSKWTALEEIGFDTNEVKIPQIVSTFSLSADSKFDSNILKQAVKPPKTSTDKSSKALEPSIKLNSIQTSQLVLPNSKHKVGETAQGVMGITDAIQQGVNMFDFETAIATNSLKKNKTLPVQIPLMPKVTVKPLNSLKSPHKRTQSKTKIINNVSLVDSNKVPVGASDKTENLYESNFENIIRHFLNSSTELNRSRNVSSRLSPTKLRKYFGSRIAKKKLKKCSDFTSSEHTLRNIWSNLKDSHPRTYNEVLANNFGTSKIDNLFKSVGQVVEAESHNDISCPVPAIEDTSISAKSLHSQSAPTSSVQNDLQIKNSSDSTALKPEESGSEIIWIDDSPPNSPNLHVIAKESADLNCLITSTPSETSCKLATNVQQIPNFSEAISNSISGKSKNLNLENRSRDKTKLLTDSIERALSFLDDSFPSLKLCIPQEIINVKDQVIGRELSSESFQHDTKRNSSFEDDPRPPRTMRACSEESDDLVIDYARCRSKSPDELELATESLEEKCFPFHNTDLDTFIKEENT